MKEKIFTLFICLLVGATFTANAQLNMTTGVSWDEIPPSEPLVLEEDFTGFAFFHSDSTSDMGNSNNSYDPNDETIIIYGYKNDTVEVPIIGSESGKITYYFEQCAFAPEWMAAYAYRDQTGQTENVSNGFVEISRDYGSSGGYAPTIRGHFTVDLRALEFVDMIQWTHSSTGGSKRGVQCEYSLDDGVTWDTLRYQPGNTWSQSFTKDPLSGTKTANGYRCDPSAYGMTWADGIYADNVMLRFLECGGQTPRIHDLKVYGTYTPPTSAVIIDKDELKIFASNKVIRLSEEAKVNVYTVAGALVKQANRANTISMNDMPNGIYLVNAISGTKVKTAKVYIQ
ncbi:T9SS type A sorting domain-containing protein [uncultured Draconibacterium sp.]|uniref:T9SS type A sorting domain-containing protein n=1 Tax=uncultured Draconibacterium sp. TaxID=1573823 RepID=UPI0032615D56